MGTNTERVVVQVVVQGSKQLDTLKNKTNKASTGVLGLSNNFVKLGASVLGAIATFRQISRLISSTLKTFTQFEFEMARVKAMTNATDKEFKKLNSSAQQLGRTTFFTAAQVAGLQVNLSKLGFTTEEVLNAQEAILLLSTAASEDLARSATVVGAAIRGFNEDASEAARFADVMAVAFTSTALDLEKFQTSMTKVSSIAAMLGFTFEETTAFLGALTDAGIEASIAGTALRQILLFLGDPTSDLSKTIGMTVNSGEDFIVALEKMNEKGVRLDDILKVVNRRQVVAFNRFLNSTEAIKGLTFEMNNATGASEEMAGVMDKTTRGAFKRLTSAWEGLIISVLDGTGKFSKSVQTVVDGITRILNKFSDANKTLEDEALEKQTNIIKEARKLQEKEGGKLSDILKQQAREISKGIERIEIEAAGLGGIEKAKDRLDELNATKFLAKETGNELTKQQEKELENLEILFHFYKREKIVLEELNTEIDKTIDLEKKKKEEDEAEIIIQRSLINQQEILLTAAKNMPERTEQEIAAKNKKIKTIETEIDRLKKLGLEEEKFMSPKEERDYQFVTYEKLIEPDLKAEAKREEIRQATITGARTVADTIFQIESQNAERRFKKEQDLLKTRLESGTISQEQYEDQIDRLNKQQFNQEKRANLGQAAMDTALNIIEVFPDPIKMGLAALVGGAQMSVIGAQQYARGGMVHGNSHANGGEKFAVGGRVVELEGGEAVINKRSTSMFRSQLSAMNAAGGGVKFADGGLLNMPSFATNQFNAVGMNGLTGAMSQGGRVYVLESDITNTQNNVSLIQSQAGF